MLANSSVTVSLSSLSPLGAKINLGNKITTYQSRQIDLFYWPVEFNRLYTIMMLDIDYPTPSKPTDRSFLIYLVCNIHANDIGKGM